jgi:hypothetical protein
MPLVSARDVFTAASAAALGGKATLSIDPANPQQLLVGLGPKASVAPGYLISTRASPALFDALFNTPFQSSGVIVEVSGFSTRQLGSLAFDWC